MENLKILQFYKGRGGRFHNAGFLSFVGFSEKLTIQHLIFQNYYWIEEKETFFNDSNNEVDYCINEDGSGWVSDDGEYDTDSFCLENNLNDKEINVILDEIANESLHFHELQRIVETYYSEYLD